MNILRKVAAILLMVLCIIGLLVCVAGLVGAWAGNTPVTEVITGALATVDNYVGLANGAVQSVSASVADVTQRLDTLNQTATNLTPKQQAQIDARVDELAQPIANLSTLSLAASQGLAGLDQTLQTLNSIPRVEVPQPKADLAAISNRLNNVSNKLASLQSTVTGVTYDGSRIAAASRALSTELQGLQGQVDQVGSNLGQTQAAVQAARERAPGLIDLASTVLSLFLALMAAGQVSLFIHALHWFKS